MSPRRRARLLAASAWPAASANATKVEEASRADDTVQPGRTLRFPHDHGAHPGSRIEWWYATGWLGPLEAPTHGLQITFFRLRTGLASALPGRFAPHHLLMAHAAVTDLAARSHHHAQHLLRWNGDAGLPHEHARSADTAVRMEHWWLRRDAATGHYAAELADPLTGLALALSLQPTQPLLLQGQAGHSRKGPREAEASHYYSQPQLLLQARVQAGGRRAQGSGRAWLDHEWSHQLLAPETQGWDWAGINLADGSALTAFSLRRRGGGAPVWAGGSWRASGQAAAQAFAPEQVQWQALRHWRSPHTGAQYPVQWALHTPAGRHELRALLDGQELAGPGGSAIGTVYWEGLAELLDSRGQRVGLGYLEMTGYAGPMRL